MAAFVWVTLVFLGLVILISLCMHFFRMRSEAGGHGLLPRFSEQRHVYREDLNDSVIEGTGWKCGVCEFGNHPERKECMLCKSTKDYSDKVQLHTNKDNGGVYRVVETPQQIKVESASAPAPAASVALQPLNMRQLAASRRLLWQRQVDGDGVMRWVRGTMPGLRLDFGMRPSTGFVRTINDAGELELEEATSVSTDFNYTIALSQNPSETTKVVVDLEDIASMQFQQKVKWFSTELHRLWLPWEFGHAEFTVDRDNILEESLKYVMEMPRHQLRQRWRVAFRNEPGLDAGGVMREWITLLCGQLFDPRFGLFAKTNGAGDSSYWINAESTDLTYFAFAGRLIGKAILEEFLLPVHLALPLLKHILAVPVSLSDLQFLDQEVYKNIEWLKANVNVEQLDLDFTVPRLVQGEWVNHELVPNGKDIEVNDDNKYEYMEALLKYRMLSGVSEQLCTFLSHLYEVVPEGMLKVFDYQELELLISGVPTIDVDDWKKHTDIRYVVANKPTKTEADNMEWFWRVLDKFDENQRARLLQFVTGSARIPPQGFKGLISNDGHVRPFNIVVFGSATKVGYLSKAHTCFNRLDLPLYKSQEEMEEYLTLIVNMDITGFTIE